jgi:hypothetical protein
MEYYIIKFKRKVLKCVLKKLKKYIQTLNIITYNFKPLQLSISIYENLMLDYLKYKWKKPILNIGSENDKNIDIILNFDWKECKLIIDEDCKPGNKYSISCNLINLNKNIHQM